MTVVAQRGKPRAVGVEHQRINHPGRQIGRDAVFARDGDQLDARRGGRLEEVGIDPRRREGVGAAQRQRLALRQVEVQLVVVHVELGHRRSVDSDVGRRKLLLAHLLDGQHGRRIAARDVHREAVDAAQVERLALGKPQVATVGNLDQIAGSGQDPVGIGKRGIRLTQEFALVPVLRPEELEVEVRSVDRNAGHQRDLEFLVRNASQTQARGAHIPTVAVLDDGFADTGSDRPDRIARTVGGERRILRGRLHGLDTQVAVFEIGRHLVHARHRQEGQGLGIRSVGPFEEVAVDVPVGEIGNARQRVGLILRQRGDDAVIVVVHHRHLRIVEEQLDEGRTLETLQIEGDRELPGVRIGEGNRLGRVGDDPALLGAVTERHHRALPVEVGCRDVALRLLRELVRHGVFVVIARRLHAILRVIEEERQVGGLGTRYGERPVDGRRSEAHVLPHEAQRGLAVGNVLVEGKRHSPRVGSVAFGADHLLGDHLVVEEYLRLERRERIAVGHRHLEVDLAAVDARRIGRNDGHLGTDVGGEQFGIVLARRRRGSDEQRQCDVFQRFHVLRILKVSFRLRRPSGTRRSTWPGWCI